MIMPGGEKWRATVICGRVGAMVKVNLRRRAREEHNRWGKLSFYESAHVYGACVRICD